MYVKKHTLIGTQTGAFRVMVLGDYNMTITT